MTLYLALDKHIQARKYYVHQIYKYIFYLLIAFLELSITIIYKILRNRLKIRTFLLQI